METDNTELSQKIKDYIDKYKNPPNSEDISKQIKECQTMGHVKNLVDKIFPDWFITVLPAYSNDYPTLQNNWEKTCKKNGCSLAQIMIVEEIESTPEFSLLSEFVECFAAAGFCVRRKLEIIPCSVCSKALPSRILYEYMKDKQLPITDKWSTKCTSC